MSLVSYASIWTNEDDSNITKKKTPSLRKTIKKTPMNLKDIGEPDEYSSSDKESNNNNNESGNEKVDDRNERINMMMSKMENVSRDNDGGGLANFSPLPNPIINKKTDIEHDSTVASRNADLPLSFQSNPMQIPPPVIRQGAESSNFISNLPDLGNFYSSYQKSYEPMRTVTRDARNYSVQSNNPMNNDKVMEKINYMVHLLEQQHNEKTSNITEDFILYTFLGVFVIFIVDSFARAGKYTR